MSTLATDKSMSDILQLDGDGEEPLDPAAIVRTGEEALHHAVIVETGEKPLDPTASVDTEKEHPEPAETDSPEKYDLLNCKYCTKAMKQFDPELIEKMQKLFFIKQCRGVHIAVLAGRLSMI